ncbi:MAG: thioredoxin [Clostridiales bacterium]|uniref:Thioredoxin n=1 Tax=Harryflintia acetispora TaxID=1849041 RepID=A0A9X8UKV9_9FIRM|nr:MULTISPECIES: thioredoxin [Oscillospiraceae]PWM35884.1 MAG: thioredoxin [Clostridiales bacterium]RGB66329.1 thioredoxin [Harryflintia acetispora]TCL44129.1 thioredoxin [Harryflintia acetispora]
MSVTTLTKENFDAEVLSSQKTVLVDFWAPWCGPCRMVSPIVDEIAKEHNEVKVGKVNIDEQPELAARFGVMSIPTLMIVKEGETVATSVGFKPKSSILQMLK